ncbi:MAG: S41 family peptidase [Planctomycetota bacterium]
MVGSRGVLAMAALGATLGLTAAATWGCADTATADAKPTQSSQPSPVLLADAGEFSTALGQAMAGAVAADPGLTNATTLKRDAISALKRGDFDLTQQLLDEAMRLRPDDPTLQQMDTWVGKFNAVQADNAEQRQKNYERELGDIALLREKGYEAYAVSATNIAAQYADDDVEFVSLEWVQEMIDIGVTSAEAYEANGQWLMAMRVWGDLAAIDEENPRWKDQLKDATRRVTLLNTFAPTILKDLRDRTQEERDEVTRLLLEKRNAERLADGEEPLPDPTTRPAGDGEDDTSLDESFVTDWRHELRGITMDMLRVALNDAQRSYVRPVEFNRMLEGGLEAVIMLATTPGLETAFPSLEEGPAKTAFVTDLEAELAALKAADPSKVDTGTATSLLKSVRAINNRSLKLDEEVLVSEFASGSLSVLDPFTAMIWPSQFAEFRKGTQGQFVGVGIQIRSEANGDLRVVSPLEGGPAIEAGIKYGDVITHIDGKNANGITDSQAVEVITGLPGTNVTLTIRNLEGEVTDHELVRRKINVRSVKGWRQLPSGGWEWMADPETGIGYIRVTNFQQSTATELAMALSELRRESANGIILDLRYNPGGLLQSAVQVADRFLGNAAVVSTKDDRGQMKPSVLRASPQTTDVKLPLVVLVNEYSASASEIVSGALKDHEVGLVVGKRTFGKGSVQMLYKLGGRGDDEAWMKLTTSHYYLPSGKNIHKDEMDTEWGVDPNVPVEMTPRQMNDAIRARQAMEVLRDDGTSATVKLLDADEEVDAETALLEKDTQLSAALLLLRMQIAGESVM